MSDIYGICIPQKIVAAQSHAHQPGGYTSFPRVDGRVSLKMSRPAISPANFRPTGRISSALPHQPERILMTPKTDSSFGTLDSPAKAGSVYRVG